MTKARQIQHNIHIMHSDLSQRTTNVRNIMRNCELDGTRMIMLVLYIGPQLLEQGDFSAMVISIQQRKHRKSRCPNIATCRVQSATCCYLGLRFDWTWSKDIQWSILPAFILKSQSKREHSGNKRADPESNNSSWSIEFHSYPILSLFCLENGCKW